MASDFQHDSPACTGILITNLGTPDAPTPSAVRRYLAEFLWDPRIVDIPRPLWWLILHGIVLRLRPRKAARAYQIVWTPEGSPLLAIGKKQAAALQTLLDEQFPGPVKLALAMRYGNPSIKSALNELRNAGCRRLLVLPLYPQYSATTTASTLDAIAATFRNWRWTPELRMVNHYHDHPDYIQALANSVREYQAEHGHAERLLLSFHGLPRRHLLQGDPYHCQCHKTARLLAEALELKDDAWTLSFQSRFGKEEWLKPYTEATLRDWGKAGVKSVQVLCPGFSADCLETLEEIAEQNRDVFLEAGGESFQYIPALNDRSDHLQALAALVKQHSAGWPEAETGWDAFAAREAQEQCLQRARAAGADH